MAGRKDGQPNEHRTGTRKRGHNHINRGTMTPQPRTLIRRAPPAKSSIEQLLDPVDLCLSMWKDWMQGDDRDLGAKTMRGLAGDGDGYGSRDIYDDQRKSDMRMGEATNAMIDSMSRIHVWAIYRACSIATAWNFPQANYLTIIAEARCELEKKLRKNICTAVLF